MTRPSGCGGRSGCCCATLFHARPVVGEGCLCPGPGLVYGALWSDFGLAAKMWKLFRTASATEAVTAGKDGAGGCLAGP
eukprot:232656-Chlamydomonas_euryale.AAC.3